MMGYQGYRGIQSPQDMIRARQMAQMLQGNIGDSGLPAGPGSALADIGAGLGSGIMNSRIRSAGGQVPGIMDSPIAGLLRGFR